MVGAVGGGGTQCRRTGGRSRRRHMERADGGRRRRRHMARPDGRVAPFSGRVLHRSTSEARLLNQEEEKKTMCLDLGQQCSRRAATTYIFGDLWLASSPGATLGVEWLATKQSARSTLCKMAVVCCINGGCIGDVWTCNGSFYNINAPLHCHLWIEKLSRSM